MPNQWRNCDLDDVATKFLFDWNQELQTAEANFITAEATLTTNINNITATSTSPATLNFGTHNPPFLDNWVHVEWVDGATLPSGEVITGTNAHKIAIQLVNYGRNHALTSSADWDNYLITVELATDASANPTSVPADIVTELNTNYSAYLTASYDTGVTQLWVYAPTFFSGAVNASITTSTAAFNALYQGTSLDVDTALDQLDTPVASSSDSPQEILAQTSGVIELSSGLSLSVTGTNLVGLRALWTLLGGDTATVAGLLPGTWGSPIVVWTRQVTTTTTAAKCDGGATTSTTSTQTVGNPNEKPSDTTDLTPYVWWLGAIEPSNASLGVLNRAGLSTTQTEIALDSDNDTIQVIPEPDLMTTYSLTTDDLAELMGLASVDGIDTVAYDTALTEIPPVSLTTGWVSPSWNWPPDHLRENLSPSLADIQAINDSPCIDPAKKSGLVSFVACVDSMVTVVQRLVERAVTLVKEPLNQVSGLLANVIQVLDSMQGVSCLFGESILSKSAQLDVLFVELEFLAYDFDELAASVEAVLNKIRPNICKVEQAIRDLIGPGEECVTQGLSVAIINLYGELKKLLPCVTNPLDYVGMLTSIQGKVQGMAALVNSMLNDIRSIQNQVNVVLSNVSELNTVDQATNTCQSAALAGTVSYLKTSFSV